MDYYIDLMPHSDETKLIADKCVEGTVVLWRENVLYRKEKSSNIFFSDFSGETDIEVKTEYLYSMYYLSALLTEYRETENEVYINTFYDIFKEFYEYVSCTETLLLELPIYAQILLFVKIFDVLSELPYCEVLIPLMKRYSVWLMNDDNYFWTDNHGLFFDLALLHLSVFLKNDLMSIKWRKKALDRINKLFDNAYYNDCTNNEHSLTYFEHNNKMYQFVIDFCNHYNINGIGKIKEGILNSKKTLITFAHSDKTVPVIGDGDVFCCDEENNLSQLFPDVGVAVIKIGKIYLTFKCKTVFQSHAHTDISSITLRYKNTDILLDSGQYNYDRYTTINRYVRSSAGHSGIFPLFIDGLFQKEFCEKVKTDGITKYEISKDKAIVCGHYSICGILIMRKLIISPNKIIVNDTWQSEKTTTIRQRFILPQHLIEGSRFNASEKILSIIGEDCVAEFKIYSDENVLTESAFGVSSMEYYKYEPTLLLDTYSENTKAGKIVAEIKITDKENKK